MKLFVACFAVFAVVAADVSELPSNEYLPPVAVAEQQFVVDELPSNEYLPPVAVAEQQVVVEPQESAALADDGYRYKTVRRLKYRHRRDVSELPSNEYLPPALNVPVAAAEQVVVEPQESAILGDDGYRYKAVRRLKYRHRRDVSELPSNEYLPPVALADELPSNEYLPPALNVPVAVAEQVVVEPQESAVLGDDGYRYKTVRRLKYRHRRDVSELPSNEYLPPVAVADQQVVVEPQESAALADDGYRYKTVRRLKYRHRRDVSELPSNEYLPPVASAPVAVAEQQVVVVPQESAVLGDDGYRYKAVRRLKYRHRRDVSELPANEYLPPVVSVPVPVAEQQVFVEPQEAAVLAEDGYRYKTVRRLKYRHRRV
ncbi:titin-like isoform X2 [Anastrepha ludens]|uniref:titin-like isoform X2 n=1 Tax=Anastrepha ludens TaxID=28586 RepID=UPI0023AF6BF8|nr:titin-like isoform X2 [Anastrepha ludens]